MNEAYTVPYIVLSSWIGCRVQKFYASPSGGWLVLAVDAHYQAREKWDAQRAQEKRAQEKIDQEAHERRTAGGWSGSSGRNVIVKL